MSSETIQRICRDLLTLGVRPGGVMLVHSSLSSLGSVPGGPETVIQGLLSALGPEGTLLLPALSYEYVTREQPVFDVLRTPSCVGAIPEHFRTRPGVSRSVHPTHSVCGVGPLAESILADHGLDRTPVGEHSPFRKLRDLGGQLLFLGCGLRPNTSMHGVEELAMPPYLFGPDIEYRIILPDGQEHQATHRRHAFAGWWQRYDRIGTILTKGSELHVGPVLQATAHLVECAPLWAKALRAMEKEPFYFVERETLRQPGD